MSSTLVVEHISKVVTLVMDIGVPVDVVGAGSAGHNLEFGNSVDVVVHGAGGPDVAESDTPLPIKDGVFIGNSLRRSTASSITTEIEDLPT